MKRVEACGELISGTRRRARVTSTVVDDVVVVIVIDVVGSCFPWPLLSDWKADIHAFATGPCCGCEQGLATLAVPLP